LKNNNFENFEKKECKEEEFPRERDEEFLREYWTLCSVYLNP